MRAADDGERRNGERRNEERRNEEMKKKRLPILPFGE
jgi:hypothetical protein